MNCKSSELLPEKDSVELARQMRYNPLERTVRMLFKDKLLELRTAAGLTQKTVAERAGMPMLTYRNYEQGTRLPGLPAFMKIIKALEVPCEVFANCEDVTGEITDAQDIKPRPRGRPPKPSTPSVGASETKKPRKGK
jgi:transcriptional regulator with XRE-family HTH domain